MLMSAPDTILVERGPGETRYALLAGEDVLEVAFARDADIQAGAVYAGRVAAVSAGTCFIDIGDTLPGVLRGKEVPREGETVAVRVLVPARAGKGAELKAVAQAIPDSAKFPSLLQAAPDAALVWREKYRGSIGRILSAPASEQRRLRKLLPDAPVEPGEVDVFDASGVEDAIEAALAPVIPLPSGGRVIIEATAGATVIDIDAGAGAPAAANAEAIPEIARALRLRNLAGHILIDIIPPKGKRTAIRAAATPLADQLVALAAADPTPTDIGGITPLGMIELTRKRVGLSIAETLTGRPAETMAYEALRRAVRTAVREQAARIALDAPPEVAALLRGRLKPALTEAMDQSKADIMVSERPGRAVDIVPL
jgi:Ribonuclease G/E